MKKLLSILFFLGVLLSFHSCKGDDEACGKKDFDFSVKSITLKKGESRQIEVRLTSIKKSDLTWTSDNTNCVQVNQGVATAINEGKALITAKAFDIIRTIEVTVVVEKDGNIEFKDKNLKDLLLKKYPELDKNKDNEINNDEASTLKEIDFSFNEKSEIPENEKITDLTGLEHFVALEKLMMKNQFVEDASPIQHLKRLKVLHLGGNNLAEINLSEYEKLDSLFLFRNERIKNIDLSKNKKLTKVFLQNMSIKTLDLSPCPELQGAYLSNSMLESVNTTGLNKLTIFDAQNCKLTSLSLKNLEALTQIQVAKNKMQNLELANLRNVIICNVSQNDLLQINLSAMPKLLRLFAFDNERLNGLDFSKNAEIMAIILSNTAIEHLDLSKNPHIESIEIDDAKNLKVINLKNNGFSDDAEYLISAPSNKNLKKVISDQGKEFDLLKKIFAKRPEVAITTDDQPSN